MAGLPQPAAMPAATAMTLGELGVRIAELWNRGGDDALERMLELDRQVRAQVATHVARHAALAGLPAGEAGAARAGLVVQRTQLHDLLQSYQQAIAACVRYRADRLQHLRALSSGRQAIAGYTATTPPARRH